MLHLHAARGRGSVNPCRKLVSLIVDLDECVYMECYASMSFAEVMDGIAAHDEYEGEVCEDMLLDRTVLELLKQQSLDRALGELV